jgi:hypothetical protein
MSYFGVTGLCSCDEEYMAYCVLKSAERLKTNTWRICGEECGETEEEYMVYFEVKSVE